MTALEAIATELQRRIESQLPAATEHRVTVCPKSKIHGGDESWTLLVGLTIVDKSQPRRLQMMTKWADVMEVAVAPSTNLDDIRDQWMIRYETFIAAR